VTLIPAPTPALPFDTSLPSPIGRLLELKSSSSESVVRSHGLSPVQRLMARPGTVEQRLWDLCGSPQAPDLLVLSGSAGSGKTATIGHLIERNSSEREGRFGDYLADATHADSPDQEQVGRLSQFFAPFDDAATGRPGGPCRLVAINTGMVMKFFSDLHHANPAHRLRGLEAHLRHRLRLPGAATHTPPEWMDAAVVVVNLDLRPTAGHDGDLFDQILSRLDPRDPDGVLGGAPRCATCAVTEWCWPMANAQTLSSRSGRTAINSAAGSASLRRGRELPPRALWDAAADLALSGLHTLPGQDPCAAVAQAAADTDTDALIAGLASNNALQQAAEGTLLNEIATADPTFQPGATQHEHLSTAGLDPGEDGRRLTTWLAGGGTPHPAVQNAAAAVAAGRTAPNPRAHARAAWLGGAVDPTVTTSETFERALSAQSQGASAADDGEHGDALLAALTHVNAGLASGFGVAAGVETFFPTEAPGPRTTDVLVRADLIDEQWLWTADTGDLTRHHNPQGADLVGYRQIALAVTIGGVYVAVDYPLWELLELAVQGASPSTIDLDRYLSLRRAVEEIGRAAGNEQRLPLLVVHRATGRRYRVAPFGPTSKLRAVEVE
jgi:hypothetical protein